MVSTAQLCLYCKGSRNLCGLGYCPLLKSIKASKEINIRQEFFGPSPSVFVGRIGYPNVFVGPMGAIETENIDIIDNPSEWFGMDYEKIIEMRSFLLRSKYKVDVHSSSKFTEENKLLAMAKKPTDVEMKFKTKPSYHMKFSEIVRPMGPSATLKEMKPAENIKIQRIVEKVTGDEIKANDSALILYEKGVNLYKITNIFSVGALGIDKKMVPTRWSITAIDDIIGKNLLNYVREYPSVNDFRVYESIFLNNKFLVLMMPGDWEFENFEAWAPGSFWSQNLKKTEIIEEYEPFKGRTKYADKQAGGYYASRLGIIEGLYNMKRQARVVVFREVYEGYMVPVGVWQVRENVRNAIKSGCEKFSTLKEALEYIRPKLRISLEEYLKKSKTLKQKRLEDFIKQ